MPVFMVHKNWAKASFVKTLEFFEQQGGHKKTWGKAWHRVLANDIEDARRICAETIEPYRNESASAPADEGHEFVHSLMVGDLDPELCAYWISEGDLCNQSRSAPVHQVVAATDPIVAGMREREAAFEKLWQAKFIEPFNQKYPTLPLYDTNSAKFYVRRAVRFLLTGSVDGPFAVAPEPGKQRINGPCSACGDGDTAMNYHTHDVPESVSVRAATRIFRAIFPPDHPDDDGVIREMAAIIDSELQRREQ